MRPATIAKRCAEISEIYSRRFEIEKESEREYGFITDKAESKIDKLNKKAEKVADDVRAKLFAKGWASEDGLTSEEADALVDRFPELIEVGNLFDLGDGSWC